ncbi:MAG: hypothetical protein K0S46_747 [Moraxellaceae bacterium]|jgi:hypothetical protein|nr:hypothetical protein [Moraxellaceae bacterium]
MHMALDNPPERPWYRQPWVWFIIALPATSVVAGLTTLGIAIVNRDSVVHDDWYKEGKAINLNLARDTQATALGLNASLRLDPLTGEAAVRLASSAASFSAPATLTLYFSHPTQADADQIVALTLRNGEYIGQLREGLKGRFHVELGSPEWRLLGTREFPEPEFSLTHE